MTLTKTQEKHVKRIKEHGYTSVSTIDSFMWRKRKTLNDLVAAGVLVKYTISPSYDGYEMAK